MGEIIDLFKKVRVGDSNIITSQPFEFRKAPWESAYFIQMLKRDASLVEKATDENPPRQRPPSLLPHTELSGGLFNTIAALFYHRADEVCMRKVYYLTGLMDCLINQVNAVLRTDLLRDIYRRIFQLKQELRIQWCCGPLDRVLLPIDQELFNEELYRKAVSEAPTMKALYSVIRKGTSEMFEVLAKNYYFYCPSSAPPLRFKN